jgi:hypothetical protein
LSSSVAPGICECGCGGPTSLARWNNAQYGHIKGQPVRFIGGHQNIGRKQSSETIARRAAKLRGKSPSESERRRRSEYNKSHGIRPSLEAARKSSLGKFREAHPSWTGGRTITNGYPCVYQPEHPRHMPNGYVYEHIVIAERLLGRALRRGEIVHHIDGDKTNNTDDNLAVLASQSEHIRLHRARGDIT